MVNKKQLSDEAWWFLKNVQRLQDDFAESIGAQIVMTDKNGDLITEMSGQMEVCKNFIQKTEEGKKNCTDTYHTALDMIKTTKEPVLMDCFAGYASLWIPVKNKKGEIVGSITGCGGRFNRGESEEEVREKLKKLADETGMDLGEDYLDVAISDVKSVTEEEMKTRAERLSKLVGVLAEETALSEAFAVGGEEW
ncbi:MAG: hypothetical protein COT67_01700 [Candidatus Tagabacteria bacterium CG09_land_8_20_14_0_10_41_14]|uniref:PocR domain-containing protein n=2 Tax=Candidatus Tagaibacteriota TaxID=1817918 RepID=A0A2H0WL96_9BACT|nr:MAG: hypothetical protein COT67_01700 [Candidatus Tagabacteria bacterium CG09_land_8_20_14_0_10_41_14]PJE73365.1 MAG: hypothetical protein COV00_00070 [Candidatus Tagabacteria bacterium CG10_big_fil_rev_8_21_14_0_10_40_13]